MNQKKNLLYIIFVFVVCQLCGCNNNSNSKVYPEFPYLKAKKFLVEKAVHNHKHSSAGVCNEKDILGYFYETEHLVKVFCGGNQIETFYLLKTEKNEKWYYRYAGNYVIMPLE